MQQLKYILLFIISSSAFAIDPSLNWQTITTDNFEIHFAQGTENLAYKTADIAERVHSKLSPRINWQPDTKTHLVISDETDQPNGYAIPFPFSRSVLFVSPPDTSNTLEDFNDWLELLITHEYTHILHLDKATGSAKSLRSILGRHFLLFPNMYQPGWLIEGLATHHETNTALGIGRGQSTLFSMMMRMEVAQGVKPVDQVNLPIRSWPMGTSSYLYGVYFYEFLSETYGENYINLMVTNYSNHIIPFMINTNTEQLFNKDVTQLWADFDAWLQQRFLAQIQQLEQIGVVSGERITDDGYFTAESVLAADGQVYYIQHGAFDHSKLMRIDPQGQHQALTDVHPGARIDVNTQNDVLIAQPEICNEYNVYYDLYLLESDTHATKDTGENDLTRITHCGRYRSAAWLDATTVVAVHIEKSISSLQQINIMTGQQQPIWQGDAGTIIGQPDISPDGTTLVASVFRKNQGWNIEQFNLTDRNWRKLTNDPAIDIHPRYLLDGSALLFSSERNNIYNIYRYDLNSHLIVQLTHELGGAFQPAQMNVASDLFYAGYSAQGSDIYKLQQPRSLTTELLPLPDETLPDSIPEHYAEIPSAEYSPWNSLKPRWWQPILLVTEEQSEFGFSTLGNDALGIHNYAFSFAWDSTNDWATGSFAYGWSNRLFFGIQRETDILLNANNVFAVARHDDAAFVVVNFPYSQIDSAWNVAVAALSSQSHDARRDPLIQATALPDTQDNTLGMAAGFNNSKHYIRSISANDGRNVRLIAESSEVFDSDYTGEVYTLDWREYVPLGGQHVLALRLVKGYGTERPEPFQLGGEDTDFSILDILNGSGNITFGKRDYALRGYAEGHTELTGRRMQLGTAEWRFPISLVERGYMAPPVGLMQLSGSFFADSGMAWRNTAGKAYTSVGAELHADLNIFYGITFKLRLGAAKGLDEIIGDSRMYLSLGAAF